MRMQLVVMAVMLVLVQAESNCEYGCQLANISITLEKTECGSHPVIIETTSCTGMCGTKDWNYISSSGQEPQVTCNFKEWSYGTYYMQDCPFGVDPVLTYPVAKSCACTTCSIASTECDPMHMDMASCLSF
uniref:Gonadotropin I beta subunit n=1 Tax=Plecoglossus altivelis TaxID=61084 RepID=Q8JG63_PLEAT|nr:gonadotropin I beta subunit precursor [Plecoglossus altivelis]